MKMWIATVALLGAMSSPAIAQTRLFSESAPIQITVSGPVSTLIQRAPRSTAPFPATLTLNRHIRQGATSGRAAHP